MPMINTVFYVYLDTNMSMINTVFYVYLDTKNVYDYRSVIQMSRHQNVYN